MPGQDVLLRSLQEILQSFDVAYIVVDAVDESMPRADLVALLFALAQEPMFRKIQLLATSRELDPIKQTFSSVASILPMSHPEVENDIRIYVHAELNGRHNYFNRWPPDLREYVEIRLAKQAQGMFRWAYCQVQRLESRSSESKPEIMEILDSLPKDLYETYYRVLSEIPEENASSQRPSLCSSLAASNGLYSVRYSTTSEG
ncbi:hypothetical protein GE09DRAFT_532957 [Coniochaeta sp. 2T2.1]|nr:hypothetical protein GE09DRAFT_532957 [Coniochaeta sp. 2T2.1]